MLDQLLFGLRTMPMDFHKVKTRSLWWWRCLLVPFALLVAQKGDRGDDRREMTLGLCLRRLYHSPSWNDPWLDIQELVYAG